MREDRGPEQLPDIEFEPIVNFFKKNLGAALVILGFALFGIGVPDFSGLVTGGIAVSIVAFIYDIVRNTDGERVNGVYASMFLSGGLMIGYGAGYVLAFLGVWLIALAIWVGIHRTAKNQ